MAITKDNAGLVQLSPEEALERVLPERSATAHSRIAPER
jgi:hypothetical protein